MHCNLIAADNGQESPRLSHVIVSGPVSDSRIKRNLFLAVLLLFAFVGSFTVLIPPAMRIVDPLTHSALDLRWPTPFPILVVQGGEPRILMLEDLHTIPAPPRGATYLVPAGKEADFQRYLNEHDGPAGDGGWVLRVERHAQERQRIELFLMGDGYFGGGAYDATHDALTPLYRKMTGPAFAFVIGGWALAMNAVLWGGAAMAVVVVRRRRAAARDIG